MSCPYLEYRTAEERGFDGERAYCGVAERFVQPMRADICNDRYDLAHDRHCEIYREHADAPGAGSDADSPSDDSTEGDR